MSINRFDRPAQAKFINTYVGMPLEELRNAGMARQQKHDQNLARLDNAVAAADNLQYIPNSADQDYVEYTRNTIQDLAMKYMGEDLSDPEVSRQLNQQLRKSIDSNRLNKIQKSHAGWSANEQYKAKLKATGKYRQELDTDPTFGTRYDSDTAGIYTHQSESLLDTRRAAEQYFNNIKANMVIDMQRGVYRSGVYQSDINRVSNQVVGDFIDTNEGVQAVKLAASRAGLNYDNLNTQERMQLAKGYLNDVGQEFVYQQEQMLPASYLKGRGIGRQGLRVPGTIQEGIRGGKLDSDILKLGLRKGNFTKDGEINYDTELPKTMLERMGDAGMAFQSPGEWAFGEETDEQKAIRREETGKYIQSRLNTITETYPELKGMSPGEIFNAYEQISENASKWRGSYSPMREAQRDAWGNLISTDVLNRAAQYVDHTGEVHTGSLGDREFVKKLGYTPEDISKALRGEDVDGSGVLVQGFDRSGSSDIPGAIRLQMFDKKHRPIAMNVTGYDQSHDAMAPINNIRSLMTTMQSGLVPYSYENNAVQGIEIVPNAKYNSYKKEWEYDPKLMKGEVIQDGDDVYLKDAQEVSFDNLIRQSFDNFMYNNPTF